MKNSYTIKGDIVEVFINHKGEKLISLFDVDDLPLLDSLPNSITLAKGYAVCGYRPKPKAWVKYLQPHRLVMGDPKGLEVDHINRNRLDNRKSNLRVLTRGQNLQNQKTDKRNSLGLRNVYQRKDGLYVVTLRIEGKLIYLGSSKDIEKASRLASDGRKKYFPYSID